MRTAPLKIIFCVTYQCVKGGCIEDSSCRNHIRENRYFLNHFSIVLPYDQKNRNSRTLQPNLIPQQSRNKYYLRLKKQKKQKQKGDLIKPHAHFSSFS